MLAMQKFMMRKAVASNFQIAACGRLAGVVPDFTIARHLRYFIFINVDRLYPYRLSR
jgi:hypothetical protein